MLFYRGFVFLVLVFISSYSLFGQNNSACNVGADIKTCDNSVSLQSLSSVPGTWEIVTGGGVISNLNSNNITVTSLPEGLSSFLWVNNDNSCRDTVSVIIPKMGVTLPIIIGNGKVVSSSEVKVSFGSILKFNTVGAVLPQTVGRKAEIRSNQKH